MRTIYMQLTIQGIQYNADSWDVNTKEEEEDFIREVTSAITEHLKACRSNGAFGLSLFSSDSESAVGG